MKTWASVLVGITVACTFAQTPVPPKRSTSAPSVSAALKSIEDNVNAQGEISYTMTSQSTVDGSVVEDHYSVETSNALVRPSSCSLEVDAKMMMNGKTQRQGRVAIQFRP